MNIVLSNPAPSHQWFPGLLKWGTWQPSPTRRFYVGFITWCHLRLLYQWIIPFLLPWKWVSREHCRKWMKPFTIINLPGTNVSKGWMGSWVSFRLCHSVFEGHGVPKEDCTGKQHLRSPGTACLPFHARSNNRSSLVTCIISQSRSPWELVKGVWVWAGGLWDAPRGHPDGTLSNDGTAAESHSKHRPHSPCGSHEIGSQT